MRMQRVYLALIALSFACASFVAQPPASVGQVRAAIDRDGAITYRTRGRQVRFAPRVTVMVSDTDPQLTRVKDAETAFWVPAWKHGKERSPDFSRAGQAVTFNAAHVIPSASGVRWEFPADERFAVEADVKLDAAGKDPVIHLRFRALKPGWYSVGYTGAPESEPAAATWLWQPLVWQEKRFPSTSFLSAESMCPLPATFVQTGEATTGLAVDPSEVPFRLPTLQNSRFGVLLRNAEGKAQPMAFAPNFGAADSHFEAGQVKEFRVRPFLRNGDWFDAYRHVARDLFGFHDYRRNGPASLNTTLDNMIDFEMNDEYSAWNADLRGFDYATDVPGTVKVVSALHPLSLAIVRDDPEIYRRRALPMIEYMMSRQKYLFSQSSAILAQNPSHLMKGPAAEVSELSALYLMSQKRSPVFRYSAEVASKTPRRLNLEMVSNGDSFQDLLALYRMTGEDTYLQKAKAKADEYLASRINTTQTDFSDVHVKEGGQFWTDFAPKWVDLQELYEETHEKRYLDAAIVGAREYMEYVWLQPTVPNRDVMVNKGGKTVISYHSRLNPDPRPMPAPEQSVPAWRLSQIGLTPEASTTYGPNPAVLLTHYAAYLLRLAQYAGDPFFRDVARSAVIGRYENFPGYDINGEYTTTYQRADYPLRPWKQLTYNEIYYNHVWPHIALLTDFLVSDAFDRSNGAVNFPWRYAQAYAYLQSKVYGDQPGAIYGEKNIHLWIPKGLLRTDQTELNYISGYNDDSLYLVFTNQSAQPVTAAVQLDPNVVPLSENKRYGVRMWQQNHRVAGRFMSGGKLDLSVAAKGITVVAIDGLKVQTRVQKNMFDTATQPLQEASFQTVTPSFGAVHGMLISMGRSLTSSYVWLEATDAELSSAKLFYREGNEWKNVTDAQYPFEFSMPMADGAGEFTWYVEGTRKDGKVVKSEQATLRR